MPAEPELLVPAPRRGRPAVPYAVISGSASSDGGLPPSTRRPMHEERPLNTQPRATLDDVARLAGVSRKTASRAYAEPEKVAPATIEKVHSAAKRLRFRPNTLARSLRRGGSATTVGFIMGELENPFYYSIASGIEKELAAHGLTLLVASTDDSEEGEERVADSLLSQRVGALVMIPAGDDQSYLDGERQLGTPIICLDRPATNLVADAVVLQNRDGAREATHALTAAGHRRIAYLCNPGAVYTQRERLAGYRQALEDADLPHDPQLELLSDDPEQAPEAMVAQILRLDDPPTAIFAGNNRMCVGALRQMRHMADPPALIGFDDFDTADVLGVSVVAHDPRELGRRAGQLVLERLEQPLGGPLTVELPTRLILRGSERAWRPLR